MSDQTQTIVVPKEVHRQLRIEAAKHDLTIGEAASKAIRAWAKTKARAAKKEPQPV